MASSSSSQKKKLALKSSDNEIFEVDEAVTMQMQTIRNIIEDCNTDHIKIIPVSNVHSSCLAKVIEYCNKHAQKSGDDEFMKIDDTKILFQLIFAANYLDIKTLMDLGCQSVADMVKDFKVEEVREFFNVENGFTPEFISSHLFQTSSNPSPNDSLIICGNNYREGRTLISLRLKKSAETVILDHPSPAPMDLVGSVNGIVCLVKLEPFSALLWNPAISQWKHLAISGNAFGGTWVTLGLGFDHDNNDLKVVKVGFNDEFMAPPSKPIAEVYSSNTDSWKLIDIDFKFQFVGATNGNTIVKGEPIFVVHGSEKSDEWNHHLVFKFNVKKHKFEKLPTLTEAPQNNDKFYIRPIDLMGSIACLTSNGLGMPHFELFLLIGEQYWWEKKYIFASTGIEMDNGYFFDEPIKAIQFSNNGEFLFAAPDGKRRSRLVLPRSCPLKVLIDGCLMKPFLTLLACFALRGWYR